MHTHLYTQMHTQTRTYAHRHRHRHTHTYTYTHTHTHTRTQTQIRTQTQTQTHAYAYTYIHICTHTHTHTCTCTHHVCKYAAHSVQLMPSACVCACCQCANQARKPGSHHCQQLKADVSGENLPARFEALSCLLILCAGMESLSLSTLPVVSD